jgi:hypothetical protein
MNGRTTVVSGSAEANIGLNALFKKLADIGTKIKGEAKTSTYENVTQDKLADAQKNAMDCRIKLIELGSDRVLPPPPTEQSDSVQIVQATMSRHGANTRGEDPSQHFVYGTAQILYTGKGPYITQRFTACLTSGNQADGTSTCSNNSTFPALQVGLHGYNFVVYLPNPWFSDNRPAQTMVCIIDSATTPYFYLDRVDRLSRASPICNVKSVNFQD